MIDITALKPRYITDDKGKKIEVILPIDIFQDLVEDIQDLAIRDQREDEDTISHEEFNKDLKSNGIL